MARLSGPFQCRGDRRGVVFLEQATRLFGANDARQTGAAGAENVLWQPEYGQQLSKATRAEAWDKAEPDPGGKPRVRYHGESGVFHHVERRRRALALQHQCVGDLVENAENEYQAITLVG